MLHKNNKFLSRIFKGGAAYIAMALSDDRHMGSDSVIECTNENGIINAYTSWTEGTSGSPRTNIVSSCTF